MIRYMLDTNSVSYIIKGQPPEVRKQLVKLPLDSIVISTVTQGELYYGLASKGNPPHLVKLIQEFLLRVEVLPWDEQAAMCYGQLRARCSEVGITLSALDMMIAAHATASKATLVTHDKAFSLIPDDALLVIDWVNG